MSDLSGTAENRFYKHTMEGTIMDRVAVAKELVSIARELDERYEETGNQKYLRLSNAVTETLKEVVAEHRQEQAMQRKAQASPAYGRGLQQAYQQLTPPGIMPDPQAPGVWIDQKTGLPSLRQPNGKVLSENEWHSLIQPQNQTAVHQQQERWLVRDV